MKFRKFGDQNNPKFIMLHGGGLSWGAFKPIIAGLQERYHLITPIIDGHGEAVNEDFVNIETAAEKLIGYIDNNCGGQVLAIGGLSLGAQILVEALSQRKSIAKYAIIESALVNPMKLTSYFVKPTYRLTYGLAKKEWFAKLQAKALFINESQFQDYFLDSQKISRESLINISLSNSRYALKDSIAECEVEALIIVGEKELNSIKKSARLLKERINNSSLYVAKKMGHGELSLGHPAEYINLVSKFISTGG